MNTYSNPRNIVVIGASAGGVEALQRLFQLLGPQPGAVFLVVMHIPAHSESNLHRILWRTTVMPVIEVSENQPLQPGVIYVATPDRHLMLDDEGVRLTRGPKECRVRPSVDVLFRSASVVYGSRVIGVVLTGALDDGTAGLWAIKDRHGMALVQIPSEAAHSSMPQSAIEHVAVDYIGTVQGLAHRISELVMCGTEEQPSGAANDRHIIENQISLEGNGIEAGVFRLGEVSRYTCPDCHGVLVQINEGSIIRFRCHTGHAYSVKTLISQINESIDAGLWHTLRAVEERILLLRQMATLARQSGNESGEAYCRDQADRAEARLEPLRSLVLDPQFFSCEPRI